MKKNPLKSNAVQSLIASLVCILLGLYMAGAKRDEVRA